MSGIIPILVCATSVNEHDYKVYVMIDHIVSFHERANSLTIELSNGRTLYSPITEQQLINDLESIWNN